MEDRYRQIPPSLRLISFLYSFFIIFLLPVVAFVIMQIVISWQGRTANENSLVENANARGKGLPSGFKEPSNPREERVHDAHLKYAGIRGWSHPRWSIDGLAPA